MLSKHPFVRIAQIARIREYDMVKESDVKEFAGLLVMALSLELATMLPDGWLWLRIMPDAWARSAVCRMIRTSTTVWLMPHFDMQESPRSLLA